MVDRPASLPGFDTSALTDSTKALADQIEPRLQAGNAKFNHFGKRVMVMGVALIALSPIAIAGFSIATYNALFSKKADVDAVVAIDTARHVELERRHSDLERAVAVLTAEFNANVATTTKSLDAIAKHSERQDEALFRQQLGVPTMVVDSKKKGR